MKPVLLVFAMFCLSKSDAQVKVLAETDTSDFQSYIIRNNLIGQQKLFSNESGTMFRLRQDGMPCWSPRIPYRVLPNVISPRGYPQPQIQIRPGNPENRNRGKNKSGKAQN